MVPSDHDRLFKMVLSAFPADFLSLFARRLVERYGITRIELVNTQLFSDFPGGERRHAELVFKPQCADPHAEFLVHVEIQSQSQSTFSRRMFTGLGSTRSTGSPSFRLPSSPTRGRQERRASTT